MDFESINFWGMSFEEIKDYKTLCRYIEETPKRMEKDPKYAQKILQILQN